MGTVTITIIARRTDSGVTLRMGPMTISWLRSFNVDKAFMATNGLSLEKGLSTPDMNVAEVKKTLCSIANEVYLLADSSKIGYDAFVQIVPLKQIDLLITDNGIDMNDLNSFRNAGLQVEIAGAGVIENDK